MLKTWRRNKAAIIWEGEPGDTRVLTYRDLYREVNRFAAVLLDLGVTKGDRVAIYMPMIPELAIALLACARIGAPHTVIFGGFSAEALRDRINDSQAKLVVTADGGWRRGTVVPLKDTTDAAVAEARPSRMCSWSSASARTCGRSTMQEGRDVWWHDALRRSSTRQLVEPEQLDSEHPLYILYTSGTTGKPKGQLHTTGGYLIGTTPHPPVDLRPQGGRRLLVYRRHRLGHRPQLHRLRAAGQRRHRRHVRRLARLPRQRPLLGARSRSTASPSSIRRRPRSARSCAGATSTPPKHDLSSLRLLGTVGEPINPEAWIWYHQHIGGARCPIVDTWWQTETGMIMITPLPGLVPTKPGSATRPFPGIVADIVDEAGNSGPRQHRRLPGDQAPLAGDVAHDLGRPRPLRGDYWAKYPAIYLTGDGARRDDDGYFWLLGRVDDVVNVSGHRLGTMEVESALVSHPAVAEAAVIGASDPIKGQAIVAFVTPRAGQQANDALATELKEHVVRSIGALARPKKIYFTAELPKTRSAKIMRRLLRDIAEGRVLGDTTHAARPHRRRPDQEAVRVHRRLACVATTGAGWRSSVHALASSSLSNNEQPRIPRMVVNRSVPPSTVIPVLVYDDVAQASTWLCDVFGFTERLRIGNHRAQLIFGDGAVIVTGRDTRQQSASPEAASPSPLTRGQPLLAGTR